MTELYLFRLIERKETLRTSLFTISSLDISNFVSKDPYKCVADRLDVNYLITYSMEQSPS